MGENEMKLPVANPAALGLFGLAMATLVMAAIKLGFCEDTPGIIPWVFFLGGLAQVFACFFEYKRGNSFTATAFGAYGLFWLAIGMLWYLDVQEAVGTGSGVVYTSLPGIFEQLAFVYIGYLIFSIYMMYAAASINKAIFFVFFAIVLLFTALVLNAFWDVEIKFAGLAELFVSITGFYASAAIILKDVAGFEVLPMGRPILKIKKIQL